MSKKIKELREGRIRWPRCRRFFRVFTTGKQGAAAGAFGMFSFVMGVVLQFYSHGLWLLAATLTTLIVAVIVSGWFVLHILPPEEYAQVSIGSATESETLQYISVDVKKACEEFRRHASSLVNPPKIPPFFERIRPVLVFILAILRRRARNIDDIKRKFAKTQKQRLRILALLELASQQIDIPVHRLSELLIEYDPALHKAHFRKLIQNLELLQAADERGVSSVILGDESHKTNLKKDNEIVLKRAEHRIQDQKDLAQFSGLHASVLRMAAVHSTAQATQEYAHAVSDIAGLIIKYTSHNMNPQEIAILRDGVNALRFVARRQRVHSGSDLNETCLNMIRTPYNSNYENLLGALIELGKSVHKEDVSKLTNNFVDDPTVIRKCIAELKHSWDMAVNRVDSDRILLVGTEGENPHTGGSFGQWYKSWLRDCVKNNSWTGNPLIITHGYSTTIREVFKRGLPSKGDLEQMRDTLKIVGMGLPDVFIIGTGELSDVDSRLMLSTLLEVSQNTAEERKRFRRVAAGNKRALTKLVEKERNVVLVLGAECFDSNGRVLHPFGLGDKDDEWIKNKVGNPDSFRAVVVAEGFKFYHDLLAAPHLFRYHLDRLRLYEPSLIDVFVTAHIVSVPTLSQSYSGVERRESGRERYCIIRNRRSQPEFRLKAA